MAFAFFHPHLKNGLLHLGHGISRPNRLDTSGWNLESSVMQQSWAAAKKRRRWSDSMRKFLLATVGLVALVGVAAPASAADLAARPYTKAPPPIVAPIYDWSGFYIGANGGGGWSNKCWDVTNFRVPRTPFGEGCHD